MKRNIAFKERFNGDAGRVWDILAALGGVEQWLPIITSCRVQGAGVGALRHCETADGGKLRERILGVDVERKSLRYRIEEGLPLSNYEGEFQVAEPAVGFVEVSWTVDLEGEPAAVEQIEAMVRSVCPAALQRLGDHARRAA
jgi:hypothetical protein